MVSLSSLSSLFAYFLFILLTSYFYLFLWIFKDKLKQYFQQFGAVHDAVVMKDPISRRSRGFGFITYEHASFVDIALAQEVHTIDSRQVRFIHLFVNFVCLFFCLIGWSKKSCSSLWYKRNK